jgi:rubrerythrin
MAEEPAWLTRLAQAGSAASADKQRRERRTGSLGAANEGKRVTSWVCKCGWTGSSQELKAGPSGVSCPVCGGAPEKG